MQKLGRYYNNTLLKKKNPITKNSILYQNFIIQNTFKNSKKKEAFSLLSSLRSYFESALAPHIISL